MNRQVKDMDLITKAKSGYQEAYTALFEYYYQIIFKHIYCIIKDYQDAEDLTMITFEKAFKKLNTYVPLFLFSTWLSKIAKTTTLDFIKYKRIRWYSDLELDHVMKVRNIENPERQLIQREDAMQIKRLIKALPKHRQEIVRMRMLGLKCREVAEVTGITTSAVAGQLRYIKQKLVS